MTAAPLPASHAALAPWAGRVRDAAAAVREAVRSGDHVFVGTACATPRALVAALEAWEFGPSDVQLLHFLTDGALPHDAAGQPATRLAHRCFFVSGGLRAAVRAGLAEYVPLSIARVPGLIELGRIPVDVAFVQVSLPDEFGYVSLGVSVDIAPAAIGKARFVVAEVNPAMPRSMGASLVHIDAFHLLVPVAAPVIEYRHPAVPSAAMEQIARYVSGVIEDGSTLQIGLGRVVNEAMKHLSDRRDLGIHSDVLTDAVIPLLEHGVLTGRRKSSHRGRIVASFAMGSERLYRLIDRNPLFHFMPIDELAHPTLVAAQHRMVSVTQAFAVDLTGQVCVDQLDGGFYGGVAAQGEFLQGAARSEGGKAIICLASTDDSGADSRIRAVLAEGEGVTVPRQDVHYVITEYGIAYLFGKSVRERALALIGIAHPQHRAALLAQAQARGWVGPEVAVRNLRAYPVEDERQIALKDRRAVLLRPAGAVDASGVRELFHGLSDRDVYTRFFRKVRGLSDRDVMRLCNLNFENEVAFVACAGPREAGQIVAHACYFNDPSTNIAETAFMVHPAWQGSGLGAALQRRLAEHARSRGVRGLVAEIMASNEPMIRLARSGGGAMAGQAEAAAKVTVESSGSTVRVTVLF